MYLTPPLFVSAPRHLTEADVQVNRVLRIDPKNEDAQKFKVDNDKKIAEHAGKQPSKLVVSQLPEIKADQVKTSTLVQDARFLMEMGRLDEAEASYRSLLHELFLVSFASSASRWR